MPLLFVLLILIIVGSLLPIYCKKIDDIVDAGLATIWPEPPWQDPHFPECSEKLCDELRWPLHEWSEDAEPRWREREKLRLIESVYREFRYATGAGRVPCESSLSTSE